MSLDERIKYAAMKARHKNILKPWYKKWWGISIIVVLILLVLFLSLCALYVVSKVQEILNNQNNPNTEQIISEQLKTINGSGNNFYLGSTNPQLTIVEFGDFACPYCGASAPVVRKIAEEYKDKIKIVWRDYLRNDDSIDLAMSARCAGEQGKFWQMHDALFNNQDYLGTASATRTQQLIAFASELKINTDKFTTCLNDRKYITQIKKDYDDGNALGIAGTPTWFANNHAITGSLPEMKFHELINGLIK